MLRLDACLKSTCRMIKKRVNLAEVDSEPSYLCLGNLKRFGGISNERCGCCTAVFLELVYWCLQKAQVFRNTEQVLIRLKVGIGHGDSSIDDAAYTQ